MQALNAYHLECLRQALQILSEGFIANAQLTTKTKPASEEARVEVEVKPVENVEHIVSQHTEETVSTLLTISCKQYFPNISWDLQKSALHEKTSNRDETVPADLVRVSENAVLTEPPASIFLKSNAEFFGNLPWARYSSIAVALIEPNQAVASGYDNMTGSKFFSRLAWNGRASANVDTRALSQVDIQPLAPASMGQLAMQSAIKASIRPSMQSGIENRLSGDFFYTIFSPHRKLSRAGTDDYHSDDIEIPLRENSAFFTKLPWQ